MKCGPLQVFLVLKISVWPAQWLEFDMPDVHQCQNKIQFNQHFRCFSAALSAWSEWTRCGPICGTGTGKRQHTQCCDTAGGKNQANAQSGNDFDIF